MQPIVGTLKPGQIDPRVGNLIDGLLLLVERGRISRATLQGSDGGALAALAAAARHERETASFGDATRQLLWLLQIQHGLGDHRGGVVDAATADLLNRLLREIGALDDSVADVGTETCRVTGRVTRAGGAPLEGATVRAFDRDLRRPEPLGHPARTDAAGRYAIEYSAREFRRSEKDRADLVVHVFAPGLRYDVDRPSAQSPIVFNAPREAEINLSLSDDLLGESEFQRHVTTMMPLLAGQRKDGGDVPIVEIEDAEIAFIAGDTGIPEQQVTWIRTAFVIAEQVSTSAAGRKYDDREEAISAVLPPLLYGWFRQGLPTEWPRLVEQPLEVLRRAALDSIGSRIIPPALESRLDAILAWLPRPRRDALKSVAALARVNEAAVATVLERAGAIAEVSNSLVTNLIEEGSLRRADAHGIGVALATHALTGGHTPATTALVSARATRLNGRSIERARDLAALDADDIERALTEAGVDAPGALTRATYARRLADTIATALPNDVLLHRAASVPDAVVAAIEAGAGKEAGNADVQAFTRLHPGLGLRAVLESAEEARPAIDTIKERVGWLDGVREQNPDLDLLEIDYLPGSASLERVKFDGLPDGAREMVIDNLKAYQRVRSLGAGAEHSLALLRAGYPSATALAGRRPSEIARETGLPPVEARAYQMKAQDKASEAAITMFAFQDLVRNDELFKKRVFLEAPVLLKQLAGYDQLFGSANFCRCDRCRSVLGPAAYFVDLMYYVDYHVIEPSFETRNGDRHQLHLRRRRPDLWTLKLTCANTNDVVPSLDLVNEMFETFIVREKGLASAAALYERLSIVDDSIRLPFSLPLERLTIYLAHLGIAHSDIANTFLRRTADAATRARIRLGMLPRQFEVVTASRLGDPRTAATLAAAEQFYSRWVKDPGLAFTRTAAETETRTLKELDVEAVFRAGGIDRKTLDAVVATTFVNGTAAGAPAKIAFRSGIAAQGGVQNDVERLTNFTAGRLDRFERFARLWRHVPWTIPELDYVITRLQAGRPPADADNPVDGPVLVTLAELLDLQQSLRIPVDELCALWDSVPVEPLATSSSLWDRTFNLAPLVGQQPRWPDAGLIEASAANRARLVAALQIDDSSLTVLLRRLVPCFGRIDVDAMGNRTFVAGSWLNERNLTLLYRHARLARLLRLSIDELWLTIDLTPIGARPAAERCVATLTDLQSIVETNRWRAASGFTVGEARFIRTGEGAPAGAESPDALARRLAAEVAAEQSLYVAADALTQVGLTGSESEAVMGANGAWLEPVPGEDAFRIRATVRVEDVPAAFAFNVQPSPAAIGTTARALMRVAVRAGEAGFEAGAVAAIGWSQADADALVAANVSAAPNDGRPFEGVPGAAARFRLRANISEAAAIAGFGASAANVAATTALLKVRALDVLVRSHVLNVLAAKAAVVISEVPDKTRALLDLAVPTAANDLAQLAGALQGGPLTTLATVLERFVRYASLFRSAAFDARALAFVRSAPAILAMSEPPTVETIRRVARYAALATAPDAAYEPNATPVDRRAIEAVISWNASIAGTNTDDAWNQLARTLRVTAAQVRSILPQVALTAGAVRLDELAQLKEAVDRTLRLCVPAEVLRMAVSADHAELQRAAEGVFAAIRSRYPDEQAFRQKLEPFDDKLRSRNRDGLVEYLLTAPDTGATAWRARFGDVNDLYHHFLTDVMVEGCARTSRVVAAISTVQLYVHRVLMNLEQSDENPNPLVVRFENPRRQEEWWWRKNYQVWVANRKVFLYPENYIEPELRDDKTPLFRELEDTLLAQDVTEQSILDAYATYLHGFEEVAGLRIAGAYHDRNHDGGDLLHLFGVTASEPPVYYYRNVRNLENADGPVFSSWQKVDLQIPVRQVSPIVYFGRLYVFWLETTTRQLTRFTDGDSTFEGYRHSTRLKYSLLRSTGSWSPAQTIRFVHADGAPATFAVTDELLRESEASKQRNTANVTLTVPWDAYQRDHTAPLEDYFPGGWPWARIYPSIVSPDGTLDDSRIRFKFEPKTRSTSGREPQYEIDLWAGTARLAERAESKLTLAAISRVANGLEITTIDAEGLAFHVATKAAGGVDLTYRKESTGVTTQALTSAYPLADVPASTELQPVSGNEMSYLLEPPQQAYLLEASFEAPDADWGYPLASSDPEFQLWRLGTSVAGEIGRSLATVGLETTLSIGRQRDLTETAAAIINRVSSITPRFSDSPTDPNAPLLTYFREVFCHIPFSIANHLNSQQRFADAQRWYHYLFDPTANEPGVDDTLRPWRYREFRERGIESLRASLTSRAALKAYREDPFNPHAIARLRPGAYQKAIFMKYIDNLLDWGDYLFTQFTMESVNEATMLYVMAADILGPRPRELGSCGELVDERNTYEAIKPLLLPPDATEGSPTDVLIEEMEQFTIATSIIWTEQFILTGQFSTAARTRAQSGRRAAGIAGGIGAPDIDAPADPAGWNRPGTVTWKEQAATSLLQLHGGEPLDGAVAVVRGGRGAPELRVSGDPVDPPEPSIGDRIAGLQGKFEARGPRGLELQDVLRQKSPGFDDVTASNRPPGKRPPEVNVPELARARLVFCIPENAELRAYWDRVEDRLHKIRNCMDIAGVRRRLELFAPEIDPRMLVRMRAAGLSLDDVMNVISGNLPPYRFAYLIDRAKQQAGLVQTFGNQVLVALEKRDEEELTRLRTVHEQNLLKLRSQATQWEIDAAVDTLESLERQRASAEYRRNYYLNLSQTGLSAPERVEQAFTHLASGLATAEAVGSLASAVASLVPNFGAPTAMTFGGREISSSLVGFSQFASAVKDASGFIATSAGLEARNLRRDEDWLHQAALAQQEIEQLTRQITAAEIRRDIATESLRVHERSIEQVQEVFDFLRDRFTNLGRLTWLSAELQKLHRLAFNAALSTARLAEQACAFEHPDHRSNTGLSGDYWGPGNAGLLAGDRLLLDLHRLEQQYIEGHDRKLEIEQSFSLARFDPDALSRLKVENKCTFSIPEWFFDLTYPGHYRRRIKGVRLTIPCVVGPYANIGATLRLVESSIRKDPQLDSRVRVPLRHLPVIAASTGQSDAGVFEFNFRDERYMPFEGAGVDSRWELTLPAAVKAFDYATISDVILRISYTAVEDGDLADDVEEETGILTQLSEQGIARTLSLRQDFPDVWHQLLETGAEVGFEIRDLHIPFFLSGFELDVASIDFLVEKLRSADPVYPTLSYAGASIAEDPAAEPGNDAAGLQRIGRTPAVAVVAKHRIEITDAGSAARTAGSTRLDPAIVKDIYLRVTLKRKKPTP